MAFPRYKNCCLCTDVKTGAIILAMISLLVEGFYVIWASVKLGHYHDQLGYYEYQKDQAKVKSMIRFIVSCHVFLACIKENSRKERFCNLITIYCTRAIIILKHPCKYNNKRISYS